MKRYNEIVKLHLSEIIPYENNPRHNDEAVDKVANSIREFGYVTKIAVDENNVIISGHTRRKALLKLHPDEDIEIEVVKVHDTPERIKALRIADNKVGELATWDDELLEKEIAEIMDLDMSEFGFQSDEEIKEELGFTVNIGISTNFLLSKMAGDFSKPDKVHTLFPEEIEKKMWPLPVSELFFVGRATTQNLFSLGIKTIGELARADEQMIQAHLKTPGLVIQGYARGQDLEPYLFEHEANKGYGNSMTAPVDIVTTDYARHLLLSLCETVGARLRTDRVKISVVAVHITTYDFRYFNKQMQLSTATDVTEEIYEAACRIFIRLWDQKTPIRQIGVHTTKVQTDVGRQYNLFDMQRFDRLETWNRTIDDIRSRFGEDSVLRASFLQGNVSHMSGGLDKERRSGVTLGIDVEKEKVRII